MDDRLVQIIGENIIKIADEWETLSVEDLLEIKELGYEKIYCVYDNWEDFTRHYLVSDAADIPDNYKYLFACIDIEKAIKYLSKELRNDYTELKSGKIVQGG